MKVVSVLFFAFAMAISFGNIPAVSAQTRQVQNDEEIEKNQDTPGTQQLEQVVVTARKKEENVQDVPISMDVFSASQLEDRTVRSMVDLIKFSPNVFIKESHVEHALTIRGISSFKSAIYSPAGFYVDDISYPLHYTQNTALFDVERIEILKGPQGTLYGRNSESGVLNIVTRQPGNERQASVNAEYASDNTYRFGVNLKQPIVKDTLYFGGAFQFDTSDGYFTNIANGDDTAMDQEHLNGRATLRWTPSMAWDIAFITDIQSENDHGGGFRYIDGPCATDRYEVRKDTDEYVDQDSNSQNLRIKYKADNFEVLSVTSALSQSLDKQNDADAWNNASNQKLNIFKIDERQYSQELRISSTGQNSFEWLAGVYGFIEDTTFDFQYDWVSMSRTMKHPVTDIDSSGLAAFMQGTWTPLQKLHITAGLRFDHQEMDGSQRDDVQGIINDDSQTFDEILPKIAVTYDIAPDIMGYVSASKGYLVGGFNWLNSPNDDTFTYDSEYTWNYEAGVKAAWCSGRLVSNLSVFYIDIKDKQVTETDPDTIATTITNAAKAHAQGLELQLQAKPLKGLDLFAGFGYTKSTFDDFTALVWNDNNTALIQKDYSGNDLTYAPRYTYNLGVQYRLSNGLFCRADYFGTDKFYGDPANKTSQSAYATLNLKVGYEQEHYDVYLWAKNVLDEEYLTWVNTSGSYTIGLDGDPRVCGVTVNIRFF
nr:TonB-dependent receptor [uncultured Desulfobacter sp.]